MVILQIGLCSLFSGFKIVLCHLTATIINNNNLFFIIQKMTVIIKMPPKIFHIHISSLLDLTSLQVNL